MKINIILEKQKIPMLELLLLYTSGKNSNITTESKKAPLNILSICIIIFHSLFFIEIDFKNITSFNKKINIYINQENEKFLDNETIKLENVEISFQNGLMLSLSVPKLKTEKEKEEKEKSNDLFTILEKVNK